MSIYSLIKYSIVSLVAISLSACIFEYDEDCETEITFKYDYNSVSKDLFHDKVDGISLYIFDKNGIFLQSMTEDGEKLSDENYRMTLELPAGEYRMVTWARQRLTMDEIKDSSKDEEIDINGGIASCIMPELIPGKSTIDEAVCSLATETRTTMTNDVIEPLWHGHIGKHTGTGGGDKVTVSLTKNTNRFRFIFHRMTPGEGAMNVNDYDFEVVARNSITGHDNAVISEHPTVYTPYFTRQANEQAVVAEINTMRLMEGDNTRLIVRHKASGKEVFNINLTEYLLLAKMEGHDWSPQEYLDRQDYFVISFFYNNEAQDNEKWNALKLTVNGWVVYLNDEEV